MKKLLLHTFASIFLLLITQNILYAGTVSLDTSFNNTGFRVQNIDPDGEFGLSLAIQPDGKIVLGGWTLSPSFYGSFVAMRLNTDGALDTTFSSDGIVTTQYSSFNQVERLLLQPDGKIILGGTRHFGQNDFAMIRYNADGSLDTSFDGDGGAASPIDGISQDYGKDMALQNDGKIVMVGTTQPNKETPTDIAVIRRNINGSFDTSFNGNGIVFVRFQDVDASADSVVLQDDGKIVIGGLLETGPTKSLLLLRLHTNGFLDTSFGNNGITLTPVSGSNHKIRTLTEQSDGKLLAGSDTKVFRYSPNGLIDNSFGNNGSVTTTQSVREIFVKDDDSFLTAGSASFSFAVSSYTSDGSLDTNFNNTGRVTAAAPGLSCFGYTLSVQSDHKIVVGGDCSISGRPHFAVFRFVETEVTTNKPIFDFDGDGKTDVSIFRPNAGQWWYLRSSDLSNAAFAFGTSSDTLVPADYTGDGKTDIAFWRETTGEWFILRSEDSSFFGFPFGTAGDIPAPGDFDGDGIADAAVYRPSSATWFIQRSSDGRTTIQGFGIPEDKPTVADFDGDGKDDIAIYRPSVSQWWQLRSTDGVIAYQFGTTGDKTIQGDYTGDGKADIGVFRPSTGQWLILRSEDSSFYGFPFGVSTDIPSPGDYDGDGTFDAAVFRPSTNTWFYNGSTSGNAQLNFGIDGDIPIPNVYSAE